MGVDCKIWLPCDARFDDIVTVMGIAAGYKWRKEKFSSSDGWYVKVSGMKVIPPNTPFMVMCPTINFTLPTVDGEKGHFVMFHGECRGEHGLYRLLKPPSTPFWISMGKKLLDFFGGKMDFNDCDETDMDYHRHHPLRIFNDPEENEPWRALQEDMTKVKPITMEDMQNAGNYASYDVGVAVKDVKSRKRRKIKKKPFSARVFADMMIGAGES